MKKFITLVFILLIGGFVQSLLAQLQAPVQKPDSEFIFIPDIFHKKISVYQHSGRDLKFKKELKIPKEIEYKSIVEISTKLNSGEVLFPYDTVLNNQIVKRPESITDWLLLPYVKMFYTEKRIEFDQSKLSFEYTDSRIESMDQFMSVEKNGHHLRGTLLTTLLLFIIICFPVFIIHVFLGFIFKNTLFVKHLWMLVLVLAFQLLMMIRIDFSIYAIIPTLIIDIVSATTSFVVIELIFGKLNKLTNS